jgi:hypothetical protein
MFKNCSNAQIWQNTHQLEARNLCTQASNCAHSRQMRGMLKNTKPVTITTVLVYIPMLVLLVFDSFCGWQDCVCLALLYINVQVQSLFITIFRYDPDLDRWTMLASMATKRIGVGVAVVNRLLYALGGFDGSNRLRSMECYDPEKDEWRFVAPMNTTRSGAGK